jgi:tripartite ATP-independent transporter DctP family solute receptor
MFKVSKKSLLFVIFAICLLVQTPFIMAAEKPIECKVATTDPPMLKMGDLTVISPAYAIMLAFQSALERYSQGRINVGLFTNGRLGDGKSTMEQVLMGNIGVTLAGDGYLATFYNDFQVFLAPYVFEDSLQLYKVLDGPFAQKLFNNMAAKTGLRILGGFENGGFRSFSNSKKVIKVPADMKGLKIRCPEGPIYLEVVKATGASPTPVAWAEVYSALQTGVADGQENSAITMLTGSIQEVQKYYTLTKHILSTGYLVAGEKHLKRLPPDLQLAYKKAAMEAVIAGRGAVRAYESLALSQLKKSGMKIYIPTPAEMKLWRRTRASSIAWLKKNVDPKVMDGLLFAAKQALITK